MNYKIEVKSKEEACLAVYLAQTLGYKMDTMFSEKWSDRYCYLLLCSDMSAGFGNESMANGDEPMSMAELRALVSLHKNPINMDKVLSDVRSDALGLLKDKEYLRRNAGGTYSYVGTVHPDHVHDFLIEIPEGAEKATLCNDYLIFWKNEVESFSEKDGDESWVSGGDNMSFSEYMIEHDDISLVWQRHTQPEELPFVDDEPSLNDQYAEIENTRKEYKLKNDMTVDDYFDTLRCADAVNHPSHYTSDTSGIECIDAMEAMLTPEQFIGYLRGNAFKYQWRYENKGGITDLEKAQWYLNKLISRIG